MVVAYDDSDGWYDHVYSGVHNPSQTTPTPSPAPASAARAPLGGQQGRCGYGPRLPLLVISPWAKANDVSHTLSDQSSIVSSSRTTGTSAIFPGRSPTSPDH